MMILHADWTYIEQEFECGLRDRFLMPVRSFDNAKSVTPFILEARGRRTALFVHVEHGNAKAAMLPPALGQVFYRPYFTFEPAMHGPVHATLVDAIRDDCGQTGTHIGCEHGICGACTVILDGDAVRSCLMFAVQADGYAITTIEGLSPGPGELSPLQDAFCETHGMQCGYCTPAMILAAHSLLIKNPSPSHDDIVEAISGNICRCTGYAQIVEAIALAAERMRGLNQPQARPEK